MTSRRDFLKLAALVAGGTGLRPGLLEAIQKAAAIDPAAETTYLDAEHVVILMQENRSFDHCFGSLQGVRGFNDPRAIALPNGNYVWLQTNDQGETYSPFNLNMRGTNATGTGSLPHTWTDQLDARNGGKHDRWLSSKKSEKPEYREVPLTLGFYSREDLPFYYALADAFTICDQNFCSSLTGTTPNRLHLWTGTIRDPQNRNSSARTRNEDLDYGVPAQWTTFPERLEDNGLSWKIYQNELSVGVGFDDEEDAWLANFGDNPMEWFTQYQVRFHPTRMSFLPKRIEQIQMEIKEERDEKKLASLHSELPEALEHLEKYTPEKYARLRAEQKSIHEKAFTTNTGDPRYHVLAPMDYVDGAVRRTIRVPQGDVLYQFRKDVRTGNLPTVSWIVAPENFSDHPVSPWYGAWYVSEVLDILTQNSEIWKKTIFILCYDENDGYFDHIPPFVPPTPDRSDTGLCSKTIDPEMEFVRLDEDERHHAAHIARGGPIGLGYRVPLIIASPWSRGGMVNSQVFDHTSILQFLEKLLSHRTGKIIRETNISAWRRAVCGDLTSVFRHYSREGPITQSFAEGAFIQKTHSSTFQKDVTGYRPLTAEEIAQINRNPMSSPHLPAQEPGTRPSCALPYELYVDGNLSEDRTSFRIRFEAANLFFGKRAVGSPFLVYGKPEFNPRSYAVVAGDSLTDSWELKDFGSERYSLKVYGPNGFFRQFAGDANDPPIRVEFGYESSARGLTGNATLKLMNDSDLPVDVLITDAAYKTPSRPRKLRARSRVTVVHALSSSHGWYDLTITTPGTDRYFKRYAGRVETGKVTTTDPAMGRTGVA
jgi:phospholipase C